MCGKFLEVVKVLVYLCGSGIKKANISLQVLWKKMLETDFKTEKLHKESYVLKLMHKAISEHSQCHEHARQITFKVYNKPIIYIYLARTQKWKLRNCCF